MHERRGFVTSGGGRRAAARDTKVRFETGSCSPRHAPCSVRGRSLHLLVRERRGATHRACDRKVVVMHTRTDDFAGLGGAIARAGLAVVLFGVLTALPLLGDAGSSISGPSQVAQADTTHTAPLGEGSSCEI